MIEYVFIDTNNGHFSEYYNFKSTANADQILEATEDMRKKDSSYSRMGSKVTDLALKLIELGFAVALEDNPRNRRYVDRIPVECISGNY